MHNNMKAALDIYAETIRSSGWAAGEPLIVKYEEQWNDFRKWANAVGIALRAQELLGEEEG